MPFEDGNRVRDQLGVVVVLPFDQPQLRGDETHARPILHHLLAGCTRLVDDLDEDRLGLLELAALDQRRGQLDPHLSSGGIVVRYQTGRPLEQLDRRARVAAPGGALSGCAQASSGAGGELCALLDEPELGRVPAGLLEVVAEDLVELDQVGAAFREPLREALGGARPWSTSEGLRRRHRGSGGA